MNRETAEVLSEIIYGTSELAQEAEVTRKGHTFTTWAVGGEHDPHKAFLSAVAEAMEELKNASC